MTILLAATLFAAGLPLHVCGCGCDVAADSQPQPAPACSHCDATPPKSKEPSNKPCPCQDCGKQLAAVHVQKATIPSSDRSVDFDHAIADLVSCDVVVGPRNASPDIQLDRMPSGSACSIPILLGHLLL